MKDKMNLKVLLVALFMVSALAIGTASVVHEIGESLSLPDVAPPEIDDPPNAAELRDLQDIASQHGISLQAATDRYAWNDNFALSVARIREAAPAAFAGAEIVDAGHAWVAFSGPIPQVAQDIIDTFTNGHSGVSVQVRTNLGFSEVELQRGIEAVHYAVFQAPEVRDASTSFDFATGQITTTVVLESAPSESALDNLRAIAAANLTDATRADIVNSITTTVVISDQQVLGGYESGTEHLGGEALSPVCTSGFGTKNTSGLRGISTAEHCDNSLTDDGASLTFKGG